MLKKIFLFLIVYIVGKNTFVFTSPPVLTSLDTGLTVIAQKMDKLPLVNIDIFIKTGTTRTENSVNYEYVIKHLLLSDTSLLYKFISKTGGVINSTILQDMTRYTLTFHKKYFSNILSLLPSALSLEEITDRELNEAYNKAREEIKQKSNIPEFYLNNLFFKNAYKNHPYSQGLFQEEILYPEKEGLMEYIDRYFSPANIVLVIVGDINLDKTIEEVKNVFEKERFRFIEDIEIKEPPLALKQVIVEKSELPSDTAYLGIAFRAPSVKDIPDVYIMDVILTLLGEGETSRLHTSLVDEKKLCQKITSDFLTQKDEGLFKIICKCSPQKIDEAKDSILKEVFKLKVEKVSTKELQKAKNLIETMVALDTETLSGKASHLGFYEVIKSYKFALTYQEEINKVTQQQIMEFSKKTFSEKNYLICILKGQGDKNDK